MNDKDRRLRSLWGNMNSRCKEGSSIQIRCPTYVGCISLFESRLSFFDWCEAEYGFNLKDDNRFWDLDKDLSLEGNMVYSPETCVFIPHKINTLFLSSGRTRGMYPQGVTFDKSANRYTAQIRKGGTTIKLGRYDCPISAHRAWQNEKLSHIIETVDSYDLGGKASLFISKRIAQLESDIENRTVSEWGIK